MFNKQKLIDEVIRRIKNKAGFDTNHYEIRKIKNEVLNINSKLSAVIKKVEDIENARYKKRKKSSNEKDSKEKS